MMNRAMTTRRWKKKEATEYVLMRSAILPALIITVDNTPWHVQWRVHVIVIVLIIVWLYPLHLSYIIQKVQLAKIGLIMHFLTEINYNR